MTLQTMSGESVRFPSRIERAYFQATGKWNGCDWFTDFGQSGLNLDGLKASEALLLAQATSGSERTDWQNAVTWLTEVEQGSRVAEGEARQAIALARFGRLQEALDHARRACAAETRYHTHLVWKPLYDTIQDALCASVRSKQIV